MNILIIIILVILALFLKKKIIIPLFCLLILLNISGCEEKSNNQNNSPKDEKNTSEKLESTDKIYQEAKVVEITDGDTVKVDIDGKIYKLRLIGVDTPEISNGEYFSNEALKFTESNLKDKTVYLEKDVSETDKYNRLLRYIWLKKPQSSTPNDSDFDNLFNALIVYNGYAHSVEYKPDNKYQQILNDKQNLAKEKHNGLWAKKEETKNEDNNQNKLNPKLYNEDGTVIGITSKQFIKNGNREYFADTTPYVIKGNSKSHIYHCPGQKDYNKISIDNVVHFATVEDAKNAGYRPAKH
ncbi:MAG: thermonuclease family protein [Erysipelotrichaceae bacterium]|nr:thermonuclease family protein [Erysipelotrichaceae bacterium]